MHDHIISPREVWVHTTSYTPPLFIKVPVPSQGIERSCNCLQWYRFCVFYDFDIWFWNCSNSVVVFAFPLISMVSKYRFDCSMTVWLTHHCLFMQCFLQNILTWSLVVFPFRSLPLPLALHSSLPHAPLRSSIVTPENVFLIFLLPCKLENVNGLEVALLKWSHDSYIRYDTISNIQTCQLFNQCLLL